LKNAPLYAVVCVSGASVLAIEILGTRILGPFYGVSLFLWSALITVTLVALSAGYWTGGRWADRDGERARLSRLAILLAGAGVWLLLVPWIRRPLLTLAEPFGLRLAVLAAAFVLFAPPLTLLGMVSPYAIRLKAQSLGEIGRTAGDLYAISTVAGVVAALATGFVLIPEVGVARLTILVGALLLAGAAAALAGDRAAGASGARTRDTSAHSSSGAALVALAFAASAPALAWRFSPDRARPDSGLLEIRDTPYAELRIVERDDRRFLLIDGGVHTVVQPDTWLTYFPYVAALDLLKYFFDAPGRLLLVGLGGGSVAKSFHADGWQVDAVEIDAAVARIARERFGLSPSEARVFVTDGRAFLAGHDARYDAIVVDAFGSSEIPFHLVTREAFALAAARLAPGGLFAINVESFGWRDPLVASFAATLRTRFPHVVALPTAEPPNAVGNVLLLASDRPLEFPDDRLGIPYDYLQEPEVHWVVVQMNHAWENRFEPDPRLGRLFTDDRNPVDVMSERVNRAARRRLHDNPSLAGVSW